MTTAERFEAHLSPEPNTGCLLWDAATRGAHHYGQFKAANREIYAAHRWAWTRANGPVPRGMQVLHRCDQPTCANVAHLFLGTQLENMRDKVAKKRQARGERIGGSKLTLSEVEHIKVLISTDVVKLGDIAKAFGCSRTNIGDIKRGRIWRS